MAIVSSHSYSVTKEFSASRLSIWSSCRLRFYFKYVAKIEKPNAPALHGGKVVHAVGEHLRKKRVDLSLSIRQLAEQLRLGITGSAIEKWEKEPNYPSPAHRRRIIEFLGFDPEIR